MIISGLRMVQARGRIRLFGAGLWRVRELKKASNLGIEVRHLGAKHGAVSDVMVETRESRNVDWETMELKLR